MATSTSTDGARTHSEIDALIGRSNRLGSDRAVTNYGGGNTSAKVSVVNPATGLPVELLYVKGSGGDLELLTADGLAVLERDRLVGLDGV
ncbi:bifunctional rhamnulose-1-phosphate aldolase/short-chain dehydrogenase, partial [Nakamurella silvestris]